MNLAGTLLDATCPVLTDPLQPTGLLVASLTTPTTRAATDLHPPRLHDWSALLAVERTEPNSTAPTSTGLTVAHHYSSLLLRRTDSHRPLVRPVRHVMSTPRRPAHDDNPSRSSTAHNRTSLIDDTYRDLPAPDPSTIRLGSYPCQATSTNRCESSQAISTGRTYAPPNESAPADTTPQLASARRDPRRRDVTS